MKYFLEYFKALSLYDIYYENQCKCDPRKNEISVKQQTSIVKYLVHWKKNYICAKQVFNQS